VVSFPPDRYDGGHILVVTAGNDTTVYLADTSGWNRHSLSRAQFLQWWEGFAAVVTPQ
jgi:predicted double-glycine peptidase